MCVRPSALPRDWAEEWDHVAVNSQMAVSPFLTRGFALAAELAGMDVLVAKLRDDALGSALLGFQFESPVKRRMRWATRLGGEMSDHCSVVGSTALLVPLLKLAGLHRFDYSHLFVGQQTDPIGRSWGSEVGYRSQFRSGEDYWSTHVRQNKRFWQDTERSLQRAARELGPLKFDWHVSAQNDLLDSLIRLKRGQYKATGAMDVLAREKNLRLLRVLYDAGGRGLPGLAPCLSILRAGDQVLALHFGIYTERVLHYWFPVYDPRFAKYSPGRLLQSFMMREAQSRGINMVDAGVGEQDYKVQTSNERYALERGTWGDSSLVWQCTRVLARVDAISRQRPGRAVSSSHRT